MDTTGGIDTSAFDMGPAVNTIWTVFTSNLPVVLGLVGGLIAVGLVIKFLRRNAK